MKIILFLTVSLSLTASFAKDKKSASRSPQQVGGQVGKHYESIFFVNETTGKPEINKAIAYVGYNELCFTGQPEIAQKDIYELIQKDDEKKSPFAKYVKKNNSIVYGYVDTKCLDEGDMEGSDCRDVRIATSCNSVMINTPDQVGGQVEKGGASYDCSLTNTTWPSNFGKAIAEGKGKATVKVATTMNGKETQFKLSNNRYARINMYYNVFGANSTLVELVIDESKKFEKMPFNIGTSVQGLQNTISSSGRYFNPETKDRYEEFKLTCELKTK